MNILISPSILSADFINLEYEAKRMLESGADLLHIDVMDGNFVPNLTVGSQIVSALHKKCELPLDVHLMVRDPLFFVDKFAAAGSSIITFHLESESDAPETINKIKSHGVKAGLSIKPGTSIEEVIPYIDKLDMVLIMTVEPGYGGQKFMRDMTKKIELLRGYAPNLDIQVDGGINAETAALCREAGANVFVSGSYIFRAPCPRQAIASLRG